jgi:hypothetical protein
MMKAERRQAQRRPSPQMSLMWVPFATRSRRSQARKPRAARICVPVMVSFLATVGSYFWLQYDSREWAVMYNYNYRPNSSKAFNNCGLDKLLRQRSRRETLGFANDQTHTSKVSV